MVEMKMYFNDDEFEIIELTDEEYQNMSIAAMLEKITLEEFINKALLETIGDFDEDSNTED